ncbi:MAG: hypothetical protein MJ252_01160 [archaeon]|nr:hypothetical protein [archaeon]
MSEIYAKEYEDYLITGDNKHLTKLVPNSREDVYVKLCQKLQKEEFSNEMRKEVENYIQSYGRNIRIQTLSLIKEYESIPKEDQEKKSEIIKRLCQLFNLNPPYEAHKKIKAHKQDKDEKEEKDSSKEEIPSKMTEEDIEKMENIYEILYKEEKDLSNVCRKFSEFFNDDSTIYHCLLKYPLDYSKVKVSSIYETLLSNNRNTNRMTKFILGTADFENFKKLMEKLFEELESKQLNQNQFNYFRNNLCDLIYVMDEAKIKTLLEIIEAKKLKDEKIDKRILELRLINEIIQRKYDTMPGYPCDTPEKRRKILNEIYEDFKKYKVTNERSKFELLLTMLQLDYELNSLNKEIFLEYIQNPLFFMPQIYNLKTEQRSGIEANCRNNNVKTRFINNFNENNESKLIKRYLKHFLSKSEEADKNFELFSKYFNSSYLSHIYGKIKFYSGKEADSLMPEEIAELNKKIKLKILPTNKKKFEVDEEIKLKLQIKNIQTLMVNIYEINTENYYLSKGSEIDEKLSLDGITPTNEQIFVFSNKPQILSVEELSLSKIPKKRGLYVVEFIGNGHSSRAIIYKGYLTLIKKSTEQGEIFFILDENNNICKGKNVGLWKNKQFFECDTEGNGAILIPFCTSGPSTYDLIAKVDDFCQIKRNILISRENYNLNAKFIFNEQSLIVGNVCQCVLKTDLFINENKTQIENMKKVNLKINLLKNENEELIPIENTLTDIKLVSGKDFEFDFRVPSKLKKIIFELEGDISLKSRTEDIHLSTSKSYDVGELLTENFLVKIINGEYIVTYMGKNGEIKAKKEIEVKFGHHYFKNPISSDNSTEKLFITNENGEVNLGKLKDFDYFIVNEMKDGTKFKFFINKPKDHLQYSKNILLMENESFTMPLINAKSKYISLRKLNKDMRVGSNHNYIQEALRYPQIKDKITIKEGLNNYDSITVSSLSSGMYVLQIDDQFIGIKVIEGKLWDKGEFIITKEKLMEYSKGNLNPKLLSISELKETKNENKRNFKLKINSDLKTNTRIHISAYHYYNDKSLINDLNSYANEIKNDLENESNNQNNKREYIITKPENIYLNNKILDEEIQYVMDRKHYESFMGNTLEKPSLALKPQFVKDTDTKIVEAQKGRDFDRPEMDMCCCKMARRECCEARCFNECADFAMKRDIRRMEQFEQNSLKLYDFIKIYPEVLRNLIPNESNEVEFEIKDSVYSFIKVTMINDDNFYEEIIPLTDKSIETQKKDLRMKTTLEEGKNYCELRKLHFLPNKGEYFLNDVNSIKYQIFDSIEKYATFFNLVINNPSIKEDFEKLKFLINFGELSLEEKFEKFSEFFSHEMNIYLYFHHEAFFNEFVKPILKYKIEKTFIDYFLLNDTENLIKFTSTEKISKLNTFEQCLLIYAIRETNPEMANGIAKNIQVIAEKNKISPQQQKTLFNTALNIKLEKEEEIANEEESYGQERFKSKKMKAKGLNAMPKGNFRMAKMAMRRNIEEEGVEECDYMMADSASSSLFNNVNMNYAKKMNLKNQLFTEAGKVKEFCETHYYNKIFSSTNSKDYVTPNEFFADLAVYWANNPKCYKNQGFNSLNFLFVPKTIQELIFALSVIDLDSIRFEAGQTFLPDSSIGMTVQANTNTYLLTKEISETSVEEENDPQDKKILIISMVKNYKRNDYNNNEDEDDEELEQFLTSQIYVQETILTNISNKNINCEILLQIPNGAIPLYNSDYTKIQTAEIRSFQTEKFRQIFYFPNEGKYSQFPTIASINGSLIGKSPDKTFEVLDSIKKSEEKATKLKDILEGDNEDDIIKYFQNSEYIKSTELNSISYKCQSPSFYNKIIQLLKSKLIYNEKIYSYSMTHGDLDTLKLYIQNKYFNEGTHLPNAMMEIFGPEFESKFFAVDESSNSRLNNHKDYYPIISNRVHKLPKAQNTILAVELRKTYHNYISYLIGLPKLNNRNYLRLCYYLLLQQRTEEAKTVYNKIDVSQIDKNEYSSFRLQYDYITAYLDFSFGYPEFTKAREISKKYEEFPLKDWKEMFDEIRSELKEYDSNTQYDTYDDIITDSDYDLSSSLRSSSIDEEEKKNKLTGQESINAKLEGKKISVISKGINSFKVKYYLIDIEILFSRTPFMENEGNKFSFIQPNFETEINSLEGGKETKTELEIPEKYHNKNLFIEICSDKSKKNLTYYSSNLHYAIFESVGEIKVLSPEMKPLPKVYVKTFCRKNDGSVEFYKDGYTDLRGRFNYAMLNSDLISRTKEFSILLSEKKYGTIIAKCKPPKMSTKPGFNFESFNNYRRNVQNAWLK